MVATRSRTFIDDIDRLEADLGLTVPELASALGVTAGTLGQWRHGKAIPSHDVRRRLDQLLALHDHLYETLAPEAVPDWLRWTPTYLGGTTPADAIAEGQADRVEALLTIIDYGMFA